MDEHGYVMATIPATTPKPGGAGDRLHRARRHVAGDARRRTCKPIVHRALRRPRPGPARRSRPSSCALADNPALARADRPRHRDRVRADAARRRRQGGRRGDRGGGRAPRRAPGDSARRRCASPSRPTKRSAAAPITSTSQRFGAVCAYTLDGGGRGELEYRKLLRRRDHRHVQGLQHASGLCEGPDGQRDQGGGRLHRAAAARPRCRRRRPRATRATCIRTRCRRRSIARASRCWCATS